MTDAKRNIEGNVERNAERSAERNGERNAERNVERNVRDSERTSGVDAIARDRSPIDDEVSRHLIDELIVENLSLARLYNARCSS